MNTNHSSRTVSLVTLSLVLLLRTSVTTAAEEMENSSRVPSVQADGFVEPKGGQRHYPAGGWYLGVYGSYTSTGLLLTQVYPQTPAARAGLQIGDRLVSVNGHRIGMNPRARLPLDVALQRYVGPSGRVRLLVQDRRTNRLVKVDGRLVWGRVHT